MFRVWYNLALLLFVIVSLPKWIWEAIRYRKHHHSFLEKIGLKLPTFNFESKGPIIWVHSISVGETKAVGPLIKRIQENMPYASVVVSVVTETGKAEAKRSIPNADQYFYLPLDFSWNIRRLMKRIRPDILILVESDFWFNLIDLAPHVALVNGDISEKSFSRFSKVPFFAKRLFRKIDLLCVQSRRFAERFERLGADPSRIVVTGNLKFDQPFPPIDQERWMQDLGVQPEDRVVTIGSTHEPEEEQLLQVLLPLKHKFPTLKILIVPRHPERFNTVAIFLDKKGIKFRQFSRHSSTAVDERVVLVDAMGILSVCYRLSEIAIVGGSFVAHVGGHNIFEPAALGVPVLFGPHMHGQRDLVELVCPQGNKVAAGRQVTLEQLPHAVDEILSSTSRAMHEAGLELADEVHGSTTRAWQALEKLLKTISLPS